MGYIYDAEGRRVEKVVVEGWNTPHPQTVVEDEYLLGLNNEQISVLNGTGQWQWTNVYAGGRQLATYDSAGTHFALTDWLGTKRMELNVTGVSTIGIGEQCQSLPYGDGLSCTGTDVNQLHFTGKQHDTESGNDYFLARYYASGMAARFLTPDWNKNPQGVPYANYADPQSLDLYSYMRDNPLSGVDADGHLELGAAPPCQQKGSNGCENYATKFKKEDAKHLAGQRQAPKPPPLAMLFTSIKRGFTKFEWTDKSGTYHEDKIPSLVKVDHRSKPGAGGPFHSDVIGQIKGLSSPAYGPKGAQINTGDIRGRWIHGGGSSLADPYDPHQRLTPTFGCTRACNVDIQRLGREITNFQLANPNTTIPYWRTEQ